MAEGIDVFTLYQNVTDWRAVRAAGKTFCYVKVSDGTRTKPTNGWGPAGRSAGVAMGGYHYAQPGDPIAQADLLISQTIANGLTDLGPALDLEAPFVPGQTAANFAIAFLQHVRDRGFLPVLYGSDSMLSYVAPQVCAAVPETWIWVARYGANPKTPWNTWQYSSSGTVAGITASAVDLSTGAIPFNTRPAPQPAPQPVVQFGEEYDMLPKVYPPVPKPADGGAQIAYDAIQWDGRPAVLNVIAIDDGCPVYVSAPANWGAKGGTGVSGPVPGTNLPSAGALWRVDPNQPGSFTVNAGTLRVFFSYSSNGRTSVQIVPTA